MKPESIDGQTVIGLAGIDWRCWFECEVDGNEYLFPVEVEIAPVQTEVNGGWMGDRITVYFSELSEAAQGAIHDAAAKELREYLEGCDEATEYGHE
jgi:hypothetical protein